MATVLYSQWIPVVLVELPGCPRPLVIEAVRQATIQFCQDSGFWRKELDGFYTVATDAEYELEPPVDSTIADVLLIKVNKREIEPKTQDDLEGMYSDWRDTSGCPTCFFLRDKQTIVLLPIADDAYPVRVIATLKPTQAAQGVDEIVFEEFKDCIKHGAIAYLAKIPEKTWTNPGKSADSQAEFNAGIVKARLSAQNGYSIRKSHRVVARFI